jgi:hypothetical protein
MFYLEACCLISKHFGIFQIYLSLISILIPCGLTALYDFYFLICWHVFYIPECDTPWWMFCVNLRRMYILLLDEVLYRGQLNLADWWRYWVQLWPSNFCLLSLSIFHRGVLKSSAIIVNSSIPPCRPIKFYSMYFDTVIRCIPLRIVTSSKKLL